MIDVFVKKSNAFTPAFGFFGHAVFAFYGAIIIKYRF
jgi:hypothetical protein